MYLITTVVSLLKHLLTFIFILTMRRLIILVWCLIFCCARQSNAQQVSPSTLKKVTLDQAFTIEGKNKCADPLLPFLLSDRSKNFYGCCDLKQANSAQSCCLLAGSACDILYTNSPRPCKGAPCCPVDKDKDKAYSTVRAFAGSVFDFNLRTLAGFFVNVGRFRGGKFRFFNKVFLKDDPLDDFCTDKGGNITIGKEANFMNLDFKGCCSKAPTSAADSMVKCCLTTGSACNGGIDCCRNAPCYNGKCEYAAGTPDEPGRRPKTSLCNLDRSIRRRYSTFNKSIQVTGTGKCAQQSLPVFHNFTSKTIRNFKGKTLSGCCRNRKYSISQDITDNCCLLAGSFCDDSVSCCDGLFCCGNVCGSVAGTQESTDLINYPQALC